MSTDSNQIAARAKVAFHQSIAALHSRRLLPFSALVVFDLATKGLALALLQKGQSIQDDALFQLVLRINRPGIGSWARSLAPTVTADQRAMIGVGELVAVASLILLHRVRLGLAYKLLAAIVLFFVGTTTSNLISRTLGGYPTVAAAVLARAGATCIYLYFWRVSKPGLLGTSMTLFAASAIGNLASLMLPPNAVVDFMYSTHAHRALNWGVFNFADLYFDVAVFCLLTFLARVAWRRLVSSRAVGV